MRKQPQSKGQLLRQRHASVKPHRCILPVRVKSAISRRSLLLSFHRWQCPPSARSRLKNSRTPQRRRPRHVNSDATSPIVCNGSGGRATFYGCQYAVPIRNTLADLGRVQGATLIIMDNEYREGILSNTVKQRWLKAMDMQFYLVKCRIAQGQFKLLWRSGQENIADYFTKMHAKVHHKITRPL